jgi:hypothetical protein
MRWSFGFGKIAVETEVSLVVEPPQRAADVFEGVHGVYRDGAVDRGLAGGDIGQQFEEVALGCEPGVVDLGGNGALGHNLR